MKKITDRLRIYMDYRGLNPNKITVDAELSIGLIGKSLKNQTGFNSDTIEKILHTYTDLNPVWFVLGDGEMLKPGSPLPSISTVPPPAPDPKDAYIIELQAEKIKYLEKEINAYKRKIEEFEKRELRSAELAMERHEKLTGGGEIHPK